MIFSRGRPQLLQIVDSEGRWLPCCDFLARAPQISVAQDDTANKQRLAFRVLMMGLDGVGKVWFFPLPHCTRNLETVCDCVHAQTRLLMHLQKKESIPDELATTIGFNAETVTTLAADIDVCDIGGTYVHGRSRAIFSTSRVSAPANEVWSEVE